MTLHPRTILAVGFVALALGVVGLVRQNWELRALRVELAVMREDAAELAALRKRHDRLRAEQLPEAELRRLRAERAADVALRAEVEQLKERARLGGR